MSCACTTPPSQPEDPTPVSSGNCGTGITVADYAATVQGAACPTVCGPTTNTACLDPNLLSANSATGKDLDTTWTNQVEVDGMTLLGRAARKLARIKGEGWAYLQNGWLTLKQPVITIKRVWAEWFRPTPTSLPIPGDGNPSDLLVVANISNGVAETSGLPGLVAEDAVVYWDKDDKKWEPRAVTNWPLCYKGPLENSEELEIVGFVKQSPDDADYLTQTRCVKKLCGTGIVVMDEVLAPGDCSDCDGPADCGSTTAHLLPYPPEDGEIYGLNYTLDDGLTWRKVVQGQHGADGRDGRDGQDGRDGRDGLDGNAGLGSGTNINYASLAAVLDYSKMPQGPKGDDGIDGVSVTGPAGPAGKDGIDGRDGRDGVDGTDGQNATGGSGTLTTPDADDLAKLSTLVQYQEFLGTPVLINSATRDTTGASQTNIYNYLTSNGGSIADPVDSGAGDLSAVNGVLLRIDALSSDPQDETSAASSVHSLDVTVNGRQLVYMIQEDTAANAADAGNLLPRISQLNTSTHCVAPYANTLGVVRTSVKYSALPASSQITKYNAGFNTVKVYVTGFLVTRKVNPAFDPSATA